jgi:Na+-transporting NADH:ubiquinone oxidoreductase subunit NqrE
MEERNETEAKETRTAKTSGLAIASFVLALITIAFNIWMIASLFAPENQQALAWAWPPGWVVLFCYPLPINTVGLVLGAIASKRGKSIYATLGIIGNAISFTPAILGLLLLFSV